METIMSKDKQDQLIETCIEINEYLDNLDIEIYTESHAEWLEDNISLEKYIENSGYESEIKELVARYGEDHILAAFKECTEYKYNDSHYLYNSTIDFISVGEIEVCLDGFGEYVEALIDYPISYDCAYINSNGHWYAELDDCLIEDKIRELMELPEGVERLETDSKRRYRGELEDQAVICFKTGERVA